MNFLGLPIYNAYPTPDQSLNTTDDVAFNSVSTNAVTDLALPAQGSHAANKAYVDSVVSTTDQSLNTTDDVQFNSVSTNSVTGLNTPVALTDATSKGYVDGNDSALLLNLDNHKGDLGIHFTEGSISHTNIQDIGANSHAQLDSKILTLENQTQHQTSSVSDTTFSERVILPPYDAGLAAAQDATTKTYVDDKVAINQVQITSNLDDISILGDKTINQSAAGTETSFSLGLTCEHLSVNTSLRTNLIPAAAGLRLGTDGNYFQDVYTDNLFCPAIFDLNGGNVFPDLLALETKTQNQLSTASHTTFSQKVILSTDAVLVPLQATTKTYVDSEIGWEQPIMTGPSDPSPYIITTNSVNPSWTTFYKGFDGSVASQNWWHSISGDFGGTDNTFNRTTGDIGKPGIANRGAWLVMDMGTPRIISQYRYYPRIGPHTGLAKSWHIIYSINGTSYASADKVDQTLANGTPVNYSFFPVKARYWGIQIYRADTTFCITQELTFAR